MSHTIPTSNGTAPTPGSHPLGPRPTPYTDPTLAAVRRANLGARLELERLRQPERRREPHLHCGCVDRLDRDIEAIVATVAELVAGRS